MFKKAKTRENGRSIRSTVIVDELVGLHRIQLHHPNRKSRGAQFVM